MDKINTFHTRTTFNLDRLDNAVYLAVATFLIISHWHSVHWWMFTAAFLWPDLVGTFPGMYWYYSRTKNEPRVIPRIIHVLYNTGHSFAVNCVVVAIWYYVTGSLEWAMLAIPIHLWGDRAIFGNTYKPFALAFEPVANPAFQQFVYQYGQIEQSAGRRENRPAVARTSH